MSANLAENVKTCLNKLNVRKEMRGQMVLQFYVGYRITGNTKPLLEIWYQKSKEKVLLNGNVSTKENPAEFGSRGCEICKLGNKWWKGPKWLQDQTQ